MATGKGIKPTTIYGLKGMSNLPAPPAPLVDRSGRATPHFVVNADVMDSGVSLRSSIRTRSKTADRR